MDRTEQRILDAVEARRDDFIAFFRKLVQTPSLTGEEEEIGRVLTEGLRERGLTDIEVIEKKPGHPNVFAYIRGTQDGPTYTFNGHMDLLPPQNSDQWPHPPYSGALEDGKIYGRGTVDMKAGTFSSFFAGIVINDLKLPIRGKVMFTGVCDEEICGELGMRYLIEKGYVAKEREDDFGINCEPTDLKEMNMATKGVMRADVEIIGKGAFGARPYLGISAIDKASLFIEEIKKLYDKLKTDPAKKHPLIEPPSVQVTLIKGGEASNLVPDRCTLTVTRRMIPGETREACLKDYQDIIDRLHAADPEFRAEVRPWESYRPPVELPMDLPIVDAFRRAEKLVTGGELELTGSEGGTDASLVVAYTGLPMPVYGPGNYKLLGTVNEYVTVEDLINAVKIYALTIYYTLGINEPA